MIPLINDIYEAIIEEDNKKITEKINKAVDAGLPVERILKEDMINADGYSMDASQAVTLTKRLI